MTVPEVIAVAAPMTTSPEPPAGLIFTKLSIITRGPISMSVPRTDSSMSAIGEMRAVGSILSILVRIGGVGGRHQRGRGRPSDSERRIVPAYARRVPRPVCWRDLVEHVGVRLQRQEAVGDA